VSGGEGRWVAIARTHTQCEENKFMSIVCVYVRLCAANLRGIQLVARETWRGVGPYQQGSLRLPAVLGVGG
jgi:hypothetical protein